MDNTEFNQQEQSIYSIINCMMSGDIQYHKFQKYIAVKITTMRIIYVRDKYSRCYNLLLYGCLMYIIIDDAKNCGIDSCFCRNKQYTQLFKHIQGNFFCVNVRQTLTSSRPAEKFRYILLTTLNVDYIWLENLKLNELFEEYTKALFRNLSHCGSYFGSRNLPDDY